MRNGNRCQHRPDHAFRRRDEGPDPGKILLVGRNLWKIVLSQPEWRGIRNPCQQNGTLSRHPRHLTKTELKVCPMMRAEKRHCRIDRRRCRGSVSADPCRQGAAPVGRCRIITSDASTATTGRPSGSYEPVPAPMFTTLIASPSAASIADAIRRSRDPAHDMPRNQPRSCRKESWLQPSGRR
jgi:hypothetical protein